jgi:hypothetical protein
MRHLMPVHIVELQALAGDAVELDRLVDQVSGGEKWTQNTCPGKIL